MFIFPSNDRKENPLTVCGRQQQTSTEKFRKSSKPFAHTYTQRTHICTYMTHYKCPLYLGMVNWQALRTWLLFRNTPFIHLTRCYVYYAECIHFLCMCLRWIIRLCVCVYMCVRRFSHNKQTFLGYVDSRSPFFSFSFFFVISSHIFHYSQRYVAALRFSTFSSSKQQSRAKQI